MQIRLILEKVQMTPNFIIRVVNGIIPFSTFRAFKF